MTIEEAKENARVALIEWVNCICGDEAPFFDIEKGVEHAMKKAEEDVHNMLSKYVDLMGRN